jgi:hypothetical protein
MGKKVTDGHFYPTRDEKKPSAITFFPPALAFFRSAMGKK